MVNVKIGLMTIKLTFAPFRMLYYILDLILFTHVEGQPFHILLVSLELFSILQLYVVKSGVDWTDKIRDGIFVYQ